MFTVVISTLAPLLYLSQLALEIALVVKLGSSHSTDTSGPPSDAGQRGSSLRYDQRWWFAFTLILSVSCIVSTVLFFQVLKHCRASLEGESNFLLSDEPLAPSTIIQEHDPSKPIWIRCLGARVWNFFGNAPTSFQCFFLATWCGPVMVQLLTMAVETWVWTPPIWLPTKADHLEGEHKTARCQIEDTFSRHHNRALLEQIQRHRDILLFNTKTSLRRSWFSSYALTAFIHLIPSLLLQSFVIAREVMGRHPSSLQCALLAITILSIVVHLSPFAPTISWSMVMAFVAATAVDVVSLVFVIVLVFDGSNQVLNTQLFGKQVSGLAYAWCVGALVVMALMLVLLLTLVLVRASDPDVHGGTLIITLTVLSVPLVVGFTMLFKLLPFAVLVMALVEDSPRNCLLVNFILDRPSKATGLSSRNCVEGTVIDRFPSGIHQYQDFKLWYVCASLLETPPFQVYGDRPDQTRWQRTLHSTKPFSPWRLLTLAKPESVVADLASSAVVLNLSLFTAVFFLMFQLYSIVLPFLHYGVNRAHIDGFQLGLLCIFGMALSMMFLLTPFAYRVASVALQLSWGLSHIQRYLSDDIPLCIISHFYVPPTLSAKTRSFVWCMQSCVATTGNGTGETPQYLQIVSPGAPPHGEKSGKAMVRLLPEDVCGRLAAFLSDEDFVRTETSIAECEASLLPISPDSKFVDTDGKDLEWL